MRVKKSFFLLLIIVLVLKASPVVAAKGSFTTKDEVVYVNLDANGIVKNAYVVNTFHMKTHGKLIDYGNYLDVRNLTDLSLIEVVNQNEIHFESEADEFYYQGELQEVQLPWNFTVSYLLDGKEIGLDQLAGATGKLDIQIETTANSDVNQLFFEHYLLQISLTLDPTIFTNIQAPKGTEANEGKNKQITFTVLPEQEEVLIVSTYVTNFEMEPIQIAAIPANIAIEDPDISSMTKEMDTLSTAINDVHEGVTALSNGVLELNNGTNELKSGSKQFYSGINELDQSSGDLVNGSKQIQTSLRQISNMLAESPEIDMPDLTELKELPIVFRESAASLREVADELANLERVIASIPEAVEQKEIEKLYKLISQEIDKEALDNLVKTAAIAQQIKEFFDENDVELSAILYELAKQLEFIADEMETTLGSFTELDQLEDLEDLSAGLVIFIEEYDTFHQGLSDYTGGVHQLATSYSGINSGMNELSSGIDTLSKGADELALGTKELQEATIDLPNEMQQKIDEFMADYDFSDFKQASFVSENNKQVGVVQFVLQTERIEKRMEEVDKKDEAETKGFFKRFLNLFK